MLNNSFILRCIELAQQAKGKTRPNPMVGAVLVHENKVIGEGYHHYYGGSHAEVNCLDSVADADKHLIPQSTLYVNLEPCVHYGLTPPCATRILSERIKKVVIGNTDPFGEVSGRGIAILKEMGVDVESGINEAEGLWLNRRFFCFHTNKRPYVILKWAQTADGFIGPEDKARLQITGPEAQELSWSWRTQEAAIMVGYITALNDDPRLIARNYKGKQPLRIALDRMQSLPKTHNLFNGEAPTWLVNEVGETMMGNIHYVHVSFDNLLPELLTRLHDARILSIIIEGGAELINSVIESGVWDEARVFTAPQNIGSGVAAPVLSDQVHATTMTLGPDTLDVYTNVNNPYSYIPGMEL